MIRSSVPPQAATRSWLLRDPRLLELFCSGPVGDRICDHFTDYVPGGDRDGDHGRRDDDGEARGAKEPTTRAIVLGCRMPARICDASTRGTTANSMPTKDAFIKGYYDGYDSGRADFRQMQSGEKQSYDAGYRYGRQDYRQRRNPNYTRYADRFDPPSEPYFRRDYQDGYSSSRLRCNRRAS